MKPTELPDARARMVDWLRSDVGSNNFRLSQMQGEILGQPVSEDAAAHLYEQECARWRAAELFYVKSSMCDLTVTAASTMPDFSLLIDDLPSEFGMMVFESPIGQSVTVDRHGRAFPPLNVTAVLWGLMAMEDDRCAPRPGVWLSFYTNHPEATQRKLGPFTYDNEAWLRLSDAPVDTIPSNPNSPARWAYITRCAWLLMQQQVTNISHVEPDRATWRRLQRKQFAVSAVRVITLRHVASANSEDRASEREYHHQWIVRGHWRKQWYPSQDRHVPIWIAPHVKGPDGAPLLGGEKVYSWSR